MAGKLAAEFHRTPCIMAISGATHLDWLNSIGYTLTFLPGMLLLLSTDASVSVCSQMSSKLRQEPFCFLAQSSREVSTQLNILEISTLQGQLVCYPKSCEPLGNVCSVHRKPKFLHLKAELDGLFCSQKEISKSMTSV